MVEPDVVETAVREWRPDASVNAMTDLGGLLHETYAVSLSDRDVVCSFWEPGQSADRFIKEVRVTEFLRDETEVPVPGILYGDAGGEAVPYRFAIAERIDGESFEGGCRAALTPSEEAAVVRQAGRCLGDLHAVATFDRAGELRVEDRPRVDGNRAWTDHLHAVSDDQIQGLTDTRFADVQRDVRDAFERGLDVVETDGFVILHGDYTPANVLVDDGTLRAVLDFEHAVAGRPERDLAHAELHFVDQAALYPDPAVTAADRRDALRSAFRAGYRERFDLAPGWERRLSVSRFLGVVEVMATFEWRAEQHGTPPAVQDDQARTLRESLATFADEFA